MDQDSTKDGAGGGDRRNWRERLGVGQDLPRISDEFRSEASGSKPDPAPGNRQADAQAGTVPGTPVARPAPMAPRFARPATPPGNGASPAPQTNGAKSVEAAPKSPGSTGLRQWATLAQSARNVSGAPRRPSEPTGGPGRQGAGPIPSSAAGHERPGYSPRTNPSPGAQRPAPSRGPAAYAQAAPRSNAATSAVGNDSFGERLRAQREAAELLAQQRLAAARDKSARDRPDAPTMLPPRKAETGWQSRANPQHEANVSRRPAAGEQPRFTFAKEEIVAAQQETAFPPQAQPAAGRRQDNAPGPSPDPYVRAGAQQAVAGAPYLQTLPEARVAATPEIPSRTSQEYRPEYRHEDEGIFDDVQPELRTLAPQANAAGYSAAYREFEDEFEEDEPRRSRGPLLLLLSLAGVAVVSGGLIYWYQQPTGTPAAEARDLPVIAAPQEPAKAEPAPQQQPLQASTEPTTRKQIYDRIIGEETLEPERIVPTEEEPQLRQIEQPEARRPSAFGESQSGGLDGSPSEGPNGVLSESQDAVPQTAVPQSQSTEPLPLPLPPPPGTGEQGDLLVPGTAETQTASASPKQDELTLPEPRESSTSSTAVETQDVQGASVEPAAGDPSPPALRATAAAASPDATVASEAAAPVPSASIYPEPTEPLPYPDPRVSSPAEEATGRPDEATFAALPAPEPMPEAEPGQVEPDAEQASDIPLPKAKPAPPAKTTTAAKPAPEAQPQRQASPSGSGPKQIVPADVASGQAPAQTRAAQQPQAQPAPSRTGTMGREYDPFNAQKSPPGAGSGAAVQQPAKPAPTLQMASLSSDAATGQTEAGGGYVVQLASFRSETEAQNDYQRLAQRHPQLVSGLKSRIQQASLGQAGSFYRLGIGPLADRGAATTLCNSLIAAGEKDCLVRRN